jgi:hypothetical protein
MFIMPIVRYKNIRYTIFRPPDKQQYQRSSLTCLAFIRLFDLTPDNIKKNCRVDKN